MKKKDSAIANFLNEKRFKQNIRRSKGKNKAPQLLSKYQVKVLSLKYYTEFNKFVSKDLKSKSVRSNIIKVPKEFSFGVSFDKTILFFQDLNYVLYEINKKVIIDFSKCEKMNIGAATFLQVTLLEFINYTDSVNKNNFRQVVNKFEIKNSKTLRVNKMLFGLRLIEDFKGMEDESKSSFLPLKLMTGLKARSNYKENIKGKIGENINRFINNSMRIFGYEFTDTGKNAMSNLIGEILGNAEDHSALNKFYVNGISFMENKDEPIVELNLAIINLGYSFYEGFIALKDKNIEVHEKMERGFSFHSSLPSFNKKLYSKESLFTLYGLQQGISRLKFKEESRGNGTMNFIRAFMNLGALGEENKKYQSKLNIISGHTVIDCTNEYKPFYEDGIHYLSLNKEQDMKKLPSKNAIFTEEKYFPGTILQVRIYMSEKYFMKVVQDD